MTKRTHMAVGILTSLIILHGKDPFIQAYCIPAAITGAVLPDIDITDSYRLFKEEISIAAIYPVMSYFIGNKLPNVQNIITSVIGLILFSILSLYGKASEHRTFTHSIIGTLLFSICFYFIEPSVCICFSASYIGHIFLDLFNKKRALFYFTQLIIYQRSGRKGGLQ